MVLFRWGAFLYPFLNEGGAKMRSIQFFDTTLRDGEQTPGVNFNTKEKVQIALQLEKWGIDVIEAGFPIASPGDFEAVQQIARQVKSMTVTGLARCQKKISIERMKH